MEEKKSLLNAHIALQRNKKLHGEYIIINGMIIKWSASMKLITIIGDIIENHEEMHRIKFEKMSLPQKSTNERIKTFYNCKFMSDFSLEMNRSAVVQTNFIFDHSDLSIVQSQVYDMRNMLMLMEQLHG